MRTRQSQGNNHLLTLWTLLHLIIDCTLQWLSCIRKSCIESPSSIWMEHREGFLQLNWSFQHWWDEPTFQESLEQLSIFALAAPRSDLSLCIGSNSLWGCCLFVESSAAHHGDFCCCCLFLLFLIAQIAFLWGCSPCPFDLLWSLHCTTCPGHSIKERAFRSHHSIPILVARVGAHVASECFRSCPVHQHHSQKMCCIEPSRECAASVNVIIQNSCVSQCHHPKSFNKSLKRQKH